MYISSLSEDIGVTVSTESARPIIYWIIYWKHQLRQLRRVRRSLDIDSVKTLVNHAFVTSRVRLL